MASERRALLIFRAEHWRRALLKGKTTARDWLELVALIVLGCGAYGAVIGAWTSPRLAIYAAVKLPLVFVLTVLLTLGFGWLAAQVAGMRMSFQQALLLTARPLAVAAVMLLALVPVALLFTFSAPPPTTEARTAHNMLYLMHTTLVGVSGLAGSVSLFQGLSRLAARRRHARRAFVVWLLAYALVGGEVAWALRPFVGSVFEELTFLRPDPLDGNVYEFILRDIFPHLFGGG